MSRHRTILALVLILLAVFVVAPQVMAQQPTTRATASLSAHVLPDVTGQAIDMPIYRESDTGLELEPAEERSIKVEGFVEQAYDTLPGTIIVADQEIVVTVDTIIRPSGALVEVGDYAVVHADVENSVATATNIRVYKDGPLTDAIEFRGMITEHPAAPYLGTWTVAGQTVIVTDVRAPSGDAPTLGYYAHVVGSVQDDETILAKSVDVLRPDEVAGQFEFEGEIQAIGEIPGEWTVGGITAWAESDVVIEGDIQVGAMAQIQGHQTTAGSLIFDQITVSDGTDDPIIIEGLIQEINVESDGYGWWQVADQTIEVDAQTFIDESQCRAVEGMWAHVVAIPGPLSPYALRIRVERPE